MVIRQLAGLPVSNPTRSYWHTEPSEQLFGHRTTAELPETSDVVVVGSGMTGAFAAHFLKHGKNVDESVVMVEAREACWGATGRNGGHCQPFLYGTSPKVASFELETYFFLRNLVEEHNIPCSWRSLPGVHAILTQEVFGVARDSVAALKKKHPEFADKIAVVSPSGSSEDEGWAKGLTLENLRVPNVQGAIVQRYAASMWPYKLVCWVLEGLLRDFAPAQFNLQTRTPVTKISRAPSSPTAASPGHRWVVQTPRGAISARSVILATNGYTPHLLPAFADLIVPVRGQIGALVPPEQGPGLDCSYVFFGQLQGTDGKPVSRDEYLVQRPPPRGELILGGGRHLARGLGVGEWRDDEVEQKVATYLRTELEDVLDLGRKTETVAEDEDKDDGKSGSSGLPATMEWTGIMGYSRDQMPWVGRVPESLGGGEGLWMASGFTGHGMPRAALCGRGVVRMMNGERQHGVPEAFVSTEARAEKARRSWGSVGTVDEMQTIMADLKAMLDDAEGVSTLGREVGR